MNRKSACLTGILLHGHLHHRIEVPDERNTSIKPLDCSVGDYDVLTRTADSNASPRTGPRDAVTLQIDRNIVAKNVDTAAVCASSLEQMPLEP
jgi:hypothetical protein